jgi:hypothetical protein
VQANFVTLSLGTESLQRPVDDVGPDEEHGSELVVFLESVVEDSVRAVGSIVEADTESLRLRDDSQIGADIGFLGCCALLKL